MNSEKSAPLRLGSTGVESKSLHFFSHILKATPRPFGVQRTPCARWIFTLIHLKLQKAHETPRQAEVCRIFSPPSSFFICLKGSSWRGRCKPNSGERGYMKIDTQLLVPPRRDASARCDHQVHVQGALHYSRCPHLPEPCQPARGRGGRWDSSALFFECFSWLRCFSTRFQAAFSTTDSSCTRLHLLVSTQSWRSLYILKYSTLIDFTLSVYFICVGFLSLRAQRSWFYLCLKSTPNF